MKEAKVCVLGHFGFGRELLNGQTIKTKIVTDALSEKLGAAEVIRIDTHGGVRNLFKAPFQVLKALRRAENILILPAHNGLRIYAPLLCFFRKFFPGKKLHYVVIGGWLPGFVENRRLLKIQLLKFDGIYVETRTMEKALENQGFSNVFVMPNCKRLKILSPAELVYAKQEPYKLCTFSRVMRQKGIEDAVEAVKTVNAHFGRTVYTLDIYGQVDPAQAQWFAELEKDFPDYVRYGGLVPFDESTQVLKDYFALLFPTHFFTEGIPGTIIDAYAAGIPVISARWESFSDMIDDEKTGYGYQFDDEKGLQKRLFMLAETPECVKALKESCIEKAERFLPEKAMEILLKQMNEVRQ